MPNILLTIIKKYAKYWRFIYNDPKESSFAMGIIQAH